MRTFTNEPLLELRRSSIRDGLSQALDDLDRSLPLEAPGLIGSERLPTSDLISTDPGMPESVVAVGANCSAGDVDRAVEVALAGRAGWAGSSARVRSQVLLRAAAMMRDRRHRLAAMLVRESGKPWPDADAEVAEAIDFIEYYSRQAIELDRESDLPQVPGERNELSYVPRGLVAVIAPWNFPLAISTGMVTAGLATGNAVLYKPAEQTPGIGHEIVQLLRSAGVPPEVISFLPGSDEPGIRLAEHPQVHTIAFTGSCAVGLEILAQTAKVHPGQRHLKRLVAEMGGKNCLIIDDDADLDEVVPAALNSAFGFAGQKCSAASRLLVHDAIYDQLTDRLTGAMSNVKSGQAEEFGVDLGPVIDAESVGRHRRYVEIGREQGRILAQAEQGPETGHFCPPTVVAELPDDSRLLDEEVFAPLVTLERVPSLEAAFQMIERSPFGLTAGLFTRNPKHARALESRSPVGNLYINREITGAMVGRQPFGGNRLSGTGTKAGGPNYLAAFVEPRVVTENTMRHGLVV
jgi:RHH-type proline utilization regulon transcriptional repressor/proline dehydrogenase/delta 1-pyrroline-5-carboxylate dehydrogenase